MPEENKPLGSAPATAQHVPDSSTLEMAALTHLSAAIAHATRHAPTETLRLLTAAYDDLRADAPFPSLTEIQADAILWAACADPITLEAYADAIIKEGALANLSQRTRKRWAANAFQKLTAEERTAFLKWTQTQ